MTKTMARAAFAGLFALAWCAACGVKNPYQGAVLKTEIPASGGSYTAGTDIRQGTWLFANTAKHPEGEKCAWTVSAAVERGGWVVIAASDDDTNNAVQSIYLASGQQLQASHCGPGGWLTFDDATWPAEPTTIPTTGGTY